MKAKNEKVIPCEVDMLDLYIATNNCKWLETYEYDVDKLLKGALPPTACKLLQSKCRLIPFFPIGRLLFEEYKMPPPSTNQIHMLVMLPINSDLVGVDHKNADFKACSRIREQLKDTPKVNALVKAIKCAGNERAGFIVLEGSSGMG